MFDLYKSRCKKKQSAGTAFLSRLRSIKRKYKNVLYVINTLNQVKQILVEKYNIEEKDINVNLKNENVSCGLDENDMNKNLNKIFNLNIEQKKAFSNKIKI